MIPLAHLPDFVEHTSEYFLLVFLGWHIKGK